MKLKPVFLIFCISHFISIAYGCEIKDVSPNYVNPGDTVSLTISLDLTDCGQINNIIIFSNGYMDTIYAEEYAELNDTTFEARFFFPDTVYIGKATICISSEYGGMCNPEGILTIGTDITKAPEICMITVDTINKNMIIWEEPNLETLDSIYIYKETSISEKYEKIGANHVENITLFIDMASYPEQNASSYKISFVDTNGYESPLSRYHKTMHLTMNIGVGGACNLIWDKYMGFYYSTFNVYRGNSVNNLQKIAELPTNLFTYTDLAPPLGKVYYLIEVEKTTGCNIGNLKSTIDYYSSARSNIIYLETTSLKDNLSDESISISIDETNDVLNILLKNKLDEYDISILALDGKEKLKQKVFNDTMLDISDLEPGIYILKIDSNKKVSVKKFIKK